MPVEPRDRYRWLVRSAALASFVACGRFRFDELRDAEDDIGAHDGPLVCQPWQVPSRIPALASTSQDWAGAISRDGTTLVFGSNRGATFDLYVSTLQGTSWSAPTTIAALDGPALDSEPSWSPDGAQLYFFSDRAQNRMYVSSTVSGFGPPMLVPGLESVSASGVAIAPDQLEMFYTVPGAAPLLSRAVRTSTALPWSPAGAVTELRSAAGDGYPTLSADGLTMYFASFRGKAGGDIYVASRTGPGAPFSVPQLVTELDDPIAGTADPDLSADGRTIFMSSDRPGGAGNYDLYVSTRICN